MDNEFEKFRERACNFLVTLLDQLMKTSMPSPQ